MPASVLATEKYPGRLRPAFAETGSVKPAVKPAEQSNFRHGGAVRSLARMSWDCPTIDQFASDPVPEEDVQTILGLATQAPSRFNSQPWRFVVVRDAHQRERLGEAARDQATIFHAPVIIVAFARRAEAYAYVDDLLGTGTGAPADASGRSAPPSREVISHLPLDVWLHRHVMIAFTYMMIAAEALGWDTAPMEGFEAAVVRSALGLPDDAEVVALLAIGRRNAPATAYPERLPVEKLVFSERFGNAWYGPAAASLSA